MSSRLGRQESTFSNVEHLAWRSLRALVLAGLPQLERSFRRYGLVLLEYHILAELYDSPAGERLGDLAATLSISPSRLSHRMDKLSRRGLVKLQPMESDARGTLALITHTGRTLVDRLATTHEAEIRRVLFAPLQQHQVRTLADALSTIAASLIDNEGERVELLRDAGAAPVAGGAQARRGARWGTSLLKEWPRRS